MKKILYTLHFILFIFTFLACKAQKPSKYELEGLKYYQQREIDKAIAMFEKGLEKVPSDRSLLNMLSSIYADMGQHEKAIDKLKTLSYYHPDYINAYWFRANSEFQIMQYEQATYSLDTFLKSKDAAPDLRKKAENLRKSSLFAATAIKTPVNVEFNNMGPEINTAAHEYFPGLTIDEQVFIFTRQERMNEDFYISRKNGESWSKAIPLPGGVNTPSNEGTVSVSADGKYIFYTACNRRDGLGSCDIYMSILQADGTFSEARNLKYPLNSGAWESQPSISPDGRTLYFASNREGGYGGIDIWKSEWTGNGFGQPINLGPNVNTELDDQAPFIHADGKTLYYSSSGRVETFGGADLYLTTMLENGEWSKPQNLGYPINTSGEEFGMIVDRAGVFAYFSADRKDSKGGRDIYKFELPKNVKPNPVNYVKGKVYDKVTKQLLQANVELIDVATNKVIHTVQSDKNTGQFLLVLDVDKNYLFNVNKEGYLFYSNFFELKYKANNTEPFIIEAPLQKPDSGTIMVLKNIFFDVDKFSLKKESDIEIKKLYDFINQYPDLKFEIGGHTDNTGKKENNQVLSENRAKVVMDKLIEMGIKKNRLSYKGYGDTMPIANNDTAEGKAQNRRTEVKVVK